VTSQLPPLCDPVPRAMLCPSVALLRLSPASSVEAQAYGPENSDIVFFSFFLWKGRKQRRNMESGIMV
jgi:hypothetical protein